MKKNWRANADVAKIKKPAGKIARAFVLGVCVLSKISSPDRIRTSDKMVNSHPLYQLSYGGISIIKWL